MSRIAGITNWMDDKVNPIVVKELRQGMQSRSFIVIVNLLLASLTLICFFAVMIDPEITVRATGGRDIYAFLQGTLFIACILFVPMVTLLRLRSERGENNVDLFFTTTLLPVKIVRGKFYAGITLITMLYSVCLPFMLFTYVLRGYDIPTMLLSLGFGYVIAVLALAAAIVVGAWSSPKALGNLFVLAAAGGLGILAFLIIMGTSEMLEQGVQSFLRDRDSLFVIALFLVSSFLIGKLLEAMAIGLISPASSNRTIRLRIWTSISMAVLFLCILGTSWFVSRAGIGSFFEILTNGTFVWMFLMLILVLAMLLIAVCEPDEFSKRIMMGRPRFAAFRTLAFPYTHGASGGLLWVVLHAAGIISIYYFVRFLAQSYGISSYSYHEFQEETRDLFRWCLFVVSYALLGKIIMRTFFPPSTAKHTWIAVLFTFFVLSVSTMLICFALDPRNWDNSLLWKLCTPLADTHGYETTIRLYFVAIWAAIVALLCIPKGLIDFARFQRRNTNASTLQETAPDIIAAVVVPEPAAD